jgi:hypothetical protein
LTEYTANPSPPRNGNSNKEKLNNVIPKEFMLPSGYPDVSFTRQLGRQR